MEDLSTKLTEANRERKSTKAALIGAKKQAEDQCQQLRKAEEQLAIAQKQIEAQKKELEKKEEALAQAKQSSYDIGVKEIEDALKAQVIGDCQGYCLQVWTKALNLVEVEASSDLRKTNNIFYPLVLRIATPPASQATTAPKAPTTTQPLAKASATTQPTTKALATTQPVDAGTTKVTSEPSKALKEKEGSKGKEVEHLEPPPTAKTDPSPSTGS